MARRIGRKSEPASRVATARGDDALTVSELAVQIQSALARGVESPVRVVGQVSNLSNRAHWFFSLKDDESSIRCVCFASTARRIRFPVEDGLEVIATGRIDFYGAQGSVQLYVDKLEPVGVGDLELRYRALCEQLRKAGYFDPARKKELPLLPRKVAVVTSRSAAALQDVINTASQRWAGCELVLCDVRVQGEAAAPEVANAIDYLSKRGSELGIDAVIVTRGGGSIEDLWAFNEKIVADAIYKCPIPIVAAIGHETDTTIAELVADVRCATPTQAAMNVIPDAASLHHQLDQNRRRLTLVMQRMLQHEQLRVDAAARFPLFRRPLAYLEPAKMNVAQLQSRLAQALPRRLAMERSRLDAASKHLAAVAPTNLAPRRRETAQLSKQLEQAASRRIKDAQSKLVALDRQLQSVSPNKVLARGYSYTLAADGSVIAKTSDARPGDIITTVLADGRLASEVTGDAPAAASGEPSKRTTRRKTSSPQDKAEQLPRRKPGVRRIKKRPPPAVEANQMDLFNGE